MIFYRLQSKDYYITPDSRSYGMCFDSIEEAMDMDLTEWDGTEEACHAYEKLESGEWTVKMAWEWMIEQGYESNNVEDGVSCFADPKKLVEYFDEHGLGLHNADRENFYVLKFEGEYVGSGYDGEDVAKFKKEIDRIDIDEFLNNNF